MTDNSDTKASATRTVVDIIDVDSITLTDEGIETVAKVLFEDDSIEQITIHSAIIEIHE